MTAQAKGKKIRVAPRKARLVVDMIRGKNVVKAMAYLNTIRNRAADPVKKILQSAIANADRQNPDADVDNFRIVSGFVDEAPVIKRFRARAMGRASSIKKRSSHITLIIGE